MKYLFLIWGNLFRKPIRTTLTILSIATAFLLFGLLQGANQAFNYQSNSAASDRLFVSSKYSMATTLPLAYKEKIEKIPGVNKVAYLMAFGGTYLDPKNKFWQLVVSPREYIETYGYKMPKEQLDAFASGRASVVAGKGLTEKYGWKIGDTIPITNDMIRNKDGNLWEFKLVGIFEGPGASDKPELFLINYDYFNEYAYFIKDTVGIFIVKIADVTSTDRISGDIDKMFSNSSAETRTSTEKAWAQSFIKQFGDVSAILNAVLGAVFFTILLLTAHTMAQAGRERIPELAVLKTLGFKEDIILTLVVLESIVLVAIGALCGLGLSVFTVSAMADILATVLPGLLIDQVVFIKAFVFALTLGVVASIEPAIRAMRLNVVDALGGR